MNCPRTSVINYLYTKGRITKERRSCLIVEQITAWYMINRQLAEILDGNLLLKFADYSYEQQIPYLYGKYPYSTPHTYMPNVAPFS
jgi:hypothetical protein